MDKNLFERLNKLALELTQAEHDGDEDRAEDIRDELWILEDQIAEESELESSTAKQWR